MDYILDVGSGYGFAKVILSLNSGGDGFALQDSRLVRGYPDLIFGFLVLLNIEATIHSVVWAVPAVDGDGVVPKGGVRRQREIGMNCAKSGNLSADLEDLFVIGVFNAHIHRLTGGHFVFLTISGAQDATQIHIMPRPINRAIRIDVAGPVLFRVAAD